MYKPGTKFIMEIETCYEALPEHSSVQPVPKLLNHLYRMKGFETLVFGAWGLRKCEKYREMKGPYGIGCVLREKLPNPKNRAQMVDWDENGEPEPKDPWMVTKVEKNEDGTWTYIGITNKGEQIEMPSTTKVEYLDLHFNTVKEWASYKGEIA